MSETLPITDVDADTDSWLPAYFTDRHWWALCDCLMGAPVPLSGEAISRPFVYWRDHGIFEVGPGRHLAAMSLLLAFQHGLFSAIDVGRKLKLVTPYGTADYWLEHTEGACFKSSVSTRTTAWAPANLTKIERRLFELQHGPLLYLSQGTDRYSLRN